MLTEQYIDIHDSRRRIQHVGLFAGTQACLTVVCVSVLEALAGTQ